MVISWMSLGLMDGSQLESRAALTSIEQLLSSAPLDGIYRYRHALPLSSNALLHAGRVRQTVHQHPCATLGYR
ncbi:hypothetical protein V2G26_010273 [Clonostachys chloroleuca]